MGAVQIGNSGPGADACMPWTASGAPRRGRAGARWRGRMSAQAGRAAEEIALRQYLRTGAELLAERWRCPHGEIDLILLQDGALVFVEVKQRKRWNGWDSPVTLRQWERLEAAASQYILDYQTDTGIHPACRFDVALVSHDGTADIIENAWSRLM